MRSASIIIRTKNEETHLGTTLRSLLSQDVKPHEIIVVDSGSTDRTREVAARYGARVVEMRPSEWSYPHALNVGAQEATGEILVCLSAHCIPQSEQWLSSMLRHFDDPTIAGVWGPDPFPNQKLAYRGPALRQEPGTYTAETSRWGMTNSNGALRRSLWLQFPFDERLPAAEDKAWGKEAMERGYALMYEPAAAVSHQRSPLHDGFRRNQAVRRGYAMIFPELQDSPRRVTSMLVRRLGRRIMGHIREPDPRRLWYEIRSAPHSIASAFGTIIGSRLDRPVPPRPNGDGNARAEPPIRRHEAGER